MAPRYTALWLFFCLTPSIVSANIVVGEIMYDAPGADDGHEWIEIQNTGALPVDISGWRFREADTNHKLAVVQGTTTIPQGGYALIVSNPEKFLSDYPGYFGTIFDSTFSLLNSGEQLVLKDTKLLDQNAVTYVPAVGGAGDGQSLQLVNGVWVSGTPTPGTLNTSSPPPQKVVTSAASPATKSAVPKNGLSVAQVRKELAKDPEVVISESPREEGIPMPSATKRTEEYQWYLALAGILIFAAGGVLYFRHRPISKTGYTIVE